MSRLNKAAPAVPALRTFEGTIAHRLTPLQELRRSVCSTMLWESFFYESGETVADRIRALVPKVPSADVAALAVYARTKMKLRHVPLLLVRELARHKVNVTAALAEVIQRPDELTEFLAIYWQDGKQPLSASVKRGLALAFQKFSAHSLAKYNRADAIKLRDVLFLVHAKPRDAAQGEVWKALADGTLASPDTWEVELSAGKDKARVFTRLIEEGKLGALALLRNLRGMTQAGVSDVVIRRALSEANPEWALPFRFIAAAKYAPRFEPELEALMFRCVADRPKLAGRTALIVDTSPSMWMAKISAKSELDRFDAAAGLAALCREVCEEVRVYTFNERAYEVPARRGFALRDAMAATKGDASCGGAAVLMANQHGYDRIIVLTDGEWHAVDQATGRAVTMYAKPSKDVIPDPLTSKAYLINVAAHVNAVGSKKWVMLDGWSESLIDFIQEAESSEVLL